MIPAEIVTSTSFTLDSPTSSINHDPSLYVGKRLICLKILLDSVKNLKCLSCAWIPTASTRTTSSSRMMEGTLSMHAPRSTATRANRDRDLHFDFLPEVDTSSTSRRCVQRARDKVEAVRMANHTRVYHTKPTFHIAKKQLPTNAQLPTSSPPLGDPQA